MRVCVLRAYAVVQGKMSEFRDTIVIMQNSLTWCRQAPCADNSEVGCVRFGGFIPTNRYLSRAVYAERSSFVEVENTENDPQFSNDTVCEFLNKLIISKEGGEMIANI